MVMRFLRGDTITRTEYRELLATMQDLEDRMIRLSNAVVQVQRGVAEESQRLVARMERLESAVAEVAFAPR